MKSRRAAAALTAALLIFGMTGCAENQIPEVTDEQLKLMGEYVAAVTLKYDSNHRSRLVDLPKTDNIYIPESTPIPDTPAVSDPEGQEDPAQQEPQATEEPVVNSYTLEEVMEFPAGVTMDFLGYRFCSSYPDNNTGEDVFLDLSATEGKKLMVLSFNLTNTAGWDQTYDLRRSKVLFQVNVDKNYSRRALMTAMEDDLSTYYGTIPAGGSTQAVLIIEVDEDLGGNLSSLTVKVKNDSKTYTIQLV